MQRGNDTAYGLAIRSTERSRGRVARVLERAIDPDALPVSVKLGNQEVDTAEYIAELADIARLRCPPASGDAVE
jgi:cysteine sulfinate desulfinase/cysteine desulfurase-like protein